jgi:hypothetical protein
VKFKQLVDSGQVSHNPSAESIQQWIHDRL